MDGIDENELRAEGVLRQYQFDFSDQHRAEILQLLQQEIDHYSSGSSEYLRVLCGYLFCIGNPDDAQIIHKAKYNIHFDVGCMIDGDWIRGLRGEPVAESREAMVRGFMEYYRHYFGLSF